MKFNSLILVIFLVVFSSCYELKKPEKPEHFLSEKEMTNILIELSVATAAKGIDKRKLEELNILPEDFVFKKYNIDSTILAQNNNYYAYQLEKYTAIYKKVTDSLVTLKEKAQKDAAAKKEKLIKLKNDSIKKVVVDTTKTNFKKFGLSTPSK